MHVLMDMKQSNFDKVLNRKMGHSSWKGNARLMAFGNYTSTSLHGLDLVGLLGGIEHFAHYVYLTLVSTASHTHKCSPFNEHPPPLLSVGRTH